MHFFYVPDNRNYWFQIKLSIHTFVTICKSINKPHLTYIQQIKTTTVC
jgi:hypothetical protein